MKRYAIFIALLVVCGCTAVIRDSPKQGVRELLYAAGKRPMVGPLLIEEQGSFFIGGRDVHSDNLSTLSDVAPSSGTIVVDQVYVCYQVPVSAVQRPNLLFMHGCCLSGASWETTPDGRMGWDEYFLRRGFSTYVVDQASRGRSAADVSSIIVVKSGKATPHHLPDVFAAGREIAWVWFRFGAEYPQVFPGLRFPHEAQDQFWKQMVPTWLHTSSDVAPTVEGLSKILDRIGTAVLIAHSQSGLYPFQVLAMHPQGISGIISVEPGSCPDHTDDMGPFTKIPILVLFGDFVNQSPLWAPRLKACREFVDAAVKAGVPAELIVLPELGITGNSHMIMQDRNSLQVADWLADWILMRTTKFRRGETE